jgi:Flp pilus assembly protein TadD
MNMLQDNGKVYLLALLLAVLVIVAYQPVLYHDFVTYDDDTYVISNYNIQRGFTAASIKWAFTTAHASNWHPVTWLSHMADYKLYKLVPSGHHLTNLLLHAANSALLLLLLWALTGSVWRSAFVAALFAVHPLHVESVAWVAERKDVLSTLFWMLTTLAYVSYVRSRRRLMYVLVMVLYAVGLMAKPMLVTLPFTLLILDYWPLQRFKPARSGGWKVFRQLFAEKLPLIAIALASCAVTFYAQRHGGAVMNLQTMPLSVRIDNAVLSYIKYLLKMAWPQNLAVPYPHLKAEIPLWQIAASLIGLTGISIWSVLQRVRRPYILAGWLWYALTLLPVIGIVQVGEQSMADRYTYIPLIGIFIAVTWLAHSILAGKKRPDAPVIIICAVACVLVLTALSLVTGKQLSHWKDSTSLYRNAIAVTVDNWVAYNNLGIILKDAGKLDEAVGCLEQAVVISPNSHQIHYNLGDAYAGLGRIDDAITEYKTCLQLKPDFANASAKLGMHYSKQADSRQAIKYFEQALKCSPKNSFIHYNIGVAQMNMGKLADAEEAFKKAVGLNPEYAKAYGKLAVVLYNNAKYADAWAALHKFEELGGADNTEFHKQLSAKMPNPATSTP